MNRFLYILLLASLALHSCRKDDDVTATPVPDGGEDITVWTVEVTLGANEDGDVIFSRQASYECIKVKINGYNAVTDGSIVITSSVPWLVLRSDIFPSDSLVSIVTADNNEGRRRTADIKFASSLMPEKNATVSITQLSASDSDSNGGNAESVCYVGYGYDIFKAYESPMSVKKTKAVLDLDKLRQQTALLGFDPVQDCRLARTENKYFTNASIYGFAEELTASQTKSTISLDGCREDCKQLEQRCQGDVFQNNFGRGCILKTVASKYVDRGALLELHRQGEEQGSPYVVPWTDDFANYVAQLITNANKKTALQKTVRSIINKYGTHIVIQADLGGRIDYSFTMSKSSSVNSIQELREEIDYTLGRIKASDRTPEFQQKTSTAKSDGMSITVRGGGAQERETLLNAAQKLDNDGQLNIDDINRWIGSVNPAANVSINECLDVVHFELIPIWELLPKKFRDIFLSTVLAMVENSDNKFEAEKMHLDLYSIDLTQKDLTDFDADGSLCKILYIDDEPILEICNEYVPKIRSDRRVTVIYPISEGIIKMSQGIFIGDGQNQPATVGFSDASCFVYPISTTAMGEILSKIYYIRGNLMQEAYGITPIPDSRRKREVQEDRLILFTEDNAGAIYHQHPIVKVGSNFWTRNDIDHYMLFVTDDDEYSNSSLDQLKNNVLYTMFQYITNYEFNAYNSWTWGYKPNTYFDANTKWYMPIAKEVKSLYEYLGFNPKALFKGELSGWDAQFNGYYGWCDIKNKNKDFSNRRREIRYAGELNVICSKNTDDYSDACLMVLDRNYSMQLIDDYTYNTVNNYAWRNNFYPVRPTRGRMYQYPLLSTIKKHIKK
ncbi:MAG: hypothetical protein II937_00540 [Bacteroidales bacterium]|nr:hypothetical protein [Bacteroidales bacterium]